jgi:hypothetical protein
MNTYRIVSGLVIVAIVAAIGYYFYQRHAQRPAGIVSEQIVHDGDAWKVDFVVRIPATEKEVFDALEQIEKSRPENAKRVTIVEQHSDSKTVDMELEGPAGMTIRTRLAFQYFPADERITYHTVGDQLLDTTGEYRLKDFEGATEIDYHQTTKMLQRLPVPDQVVRNIIRNLFMAQLSGLRRALDVASDEEEGD